MSTNKIEAVEAPSAQAVAGATATQSREESPGSGSSFARIRDSFGALGSKALLLLVTVVVMAIGFIASPHFLTTGNLTTVLITASVVSVLAVGQFTVIVTGGIDLSVGSVAALSSVVGGITLQHTHSFPLAVVAGLVVAVVVGLLNGVLIVYGGVTPFIVTLAMMNVARGLAYMIQTGTHVSIDSQTFLNVLNGNLGPLPHSVLIALIVMVIAMIVMAYMPFGRRLYAIGGNSEAARLSGLPVKRDLVSAYLVSSVLAGLAGLMMAAQLTEGSAIMGDGYELNSIAAVVVGGASLFGGTGDPFSAVVGGLVMAVILNIMDILGVGAQSQLVVKGAVIVLAVLFTTGAGRKVLQRLFKRRARV